MKEHAKTPHIKAAARDAIGVSTVRSGRKSCNFVGCQQLAHGAPVSGMPLRYTSPDRSRFLRRESP